MSMTDRCARHTVTAKDGTRIAVHTHLGEASSEEALAYRPTVLLSNGVGTTENFWRFLVADLVQDFRVVHWDYRGHGSSGEAAAGDYRLEAHVEDLARVTREVMVRGDGRPPHHVGFSMGVRVVLELYRRSPELVPSMTLLAGSARPPGAGLLPFSLPGVLPAVRRLMDAATPLVPLVSPLVHAFLASPLAWPTARASRVVRPRASRQDIVAMLVGLRRMDPLAFWLSLRGLMEGDSSDVLPHISVPCQLIAAVNDTLMPLAELERMRRAIPRAHYLRVEDAGHAGLVEAGAEMAGALRTFLKSLPKEHSEPPGSRRRQRKGHKGLH
jgi:pimeloyl-ACP methyl ester carboxylesterase